TATVSSSTTDPVPGNNSATDTDTVSERADLQISKNDGVTSVNAGGSTTYTIRVTNNGPSSVTGATLTDAAPTGRSKTDVSCSVLQPPQADGVTSGNPGGSTTYTSRVTNNGPSSVTGATLTDAAATGLSKTAVVCSGAVGNKCTSAPSIASLEGAGYSLPTLASGDFFEITLSTNVTATTGSVSNVAAVSSTTTDPTPANNSATDTDTVSERADLAISKTDGVTSVN